MRVDGKRALVIGGGGGGIGRAVTEAFGNEGASVVVADLDPERAEQAAEAVRRNGGTAYPVSGDVRSPADLDAMIGTAVVYLASEDSSYITGQQIVLDGGVSARGPFDRWRSPLRGVPRPCGCSAIIRRDIRRCSN